MLYQDQLGYLHEVPDYGYGDYAEYPADYVGEYPEYAEYPEYVGEYPEGVVAEYPDAYGQVVYDGLGNPLGLPFLAPAISALAPTALRAVGGVLPGIARGIGRLFGGGRRAPAPPLPAFPSPGGIPGLISRAIGAGAGGGLMRRRGCPPPVRVNVFCPRPRIRALPPGVPPVPPPGIPPGAPAAFAPPAFAPARRRRGRRRR